MLIYFDFKRNFVIVVNVEFNHSKCVSMNNEMKPVPVILEELKECKAISKAQTGLRTTVAKQLFNSTGDSI